jgi:two-component system response regulator YesN
LLQQKDVPECLDFFRENYPKVVNQQLVVAVVLLPVFREGEKRHTSVQKLLNLSMGQVDLKGKGITMLGVAEKNIVLILYSDECDQNEEKIAKEVVWMVGQECGSQMKYSVGNRVKGIGEIAKSYYEAVALIESEKEQIGELIRNSCETENQLFKDVFEEMKVALCTNIDNLNYVMRIMDAFEMAVQSYNLADKYVRQCCFDLASAVYFSYIAQGNSKKNQGLEVFVDTIHSAKPEETCSITRQFLVKLLGKDEDSHEIITRAKVFINQNLSESLSVSLIANELHLSPNYFSRLFKRVVKEGCNEYIVRKRMERARELLVTTNMNTGKIASMVGYVDSNYFSIAFKKYYGVAPSLFRKKDMK